MLELYKSLANSIGGLNSALKIAVINAENINTPGYKYVSASFTTLYGQLVSGGTDKTNPISYGGSMTLGATNTDFSQGNIGQGTALDVAVVGEGFFIISKSAGDTDSSTKAYTRLGRFQLDSSNNTLVDAFGRKVYGFQVDSAGNQLNDTLVAVQSDGNKDIGFTANGVLAGNFTAHTEDVKAGINPPRALIPLYKLALTTFPNKQGLASLEGTAFGETVASGVPDTEGTALEGQYGSIVPQSLEASNTDVPTVALNMAMLNRVYSATQGLLDDVNKIMSGLISKLQ